MSDNYGIETRRRSRSKTPATLAQENGDSGKKKSAIPIISLIEEEDDIVEVANPRPKRVRRSKPAADGDSQSSPDKSSQKSASQKSTITTSKSVVSNGNGEHVKSSTVTTTLSETTTAVTDGNQSMFSSIFTAIKTSTPILSSKKSKRRTDINTKDVNVAEHPAYKEYREAGEYWNKFPKTDYTYSELSPHRRELSNGMIAMPNMSRKSLDNHAIRVEDMIAQNPLDETFLRKKYLSTSQSTSFQRRTADLLYDSADEVDSLNEFRAQLRARRKRNPKLLVQAFYLSILTFFSSIYAKARSIVVRSPSQSVYTPARRPYYQQKGIFARSFESIQRFFLIGFSKIYLFISTVLCADTWLLYTRSEKTEDNRKRRRFLLGLLALLPLLLFGAFLLSNDSICDQFVALISSPFKFNRVNLAFVSKESLFRLLPSPPSINLNIFSLSWLWPSLTAFGAGLKSLLPSRSSTNEQLRMGFDEEKFQALFAHIDQYIEKAIDQRIDVKNEKLLKDFNQKLTITIASTFEEKLTSFQYKLTESDLALISQRLSLIISENDKHLTAKLTKLTEEHVKVINENVRKDLNIQINNIKLEKQDINVDDIIASVMQSDKFSAIIQGNLDAIWAKLKEHDAELSSIKLDITAIRAEIVNKFLVVNEDVKGITNNLRIIDDDIKQFKLDNAGKMQEILALIDEKIKSSTESQFPSIDASVRQNVLKILGYEQSEYDEKSIKDWISGIFVAREYLDERLKNMELNGVADVQQHIDKSSAQLMNEISEQIKSQITLAVATKTKDLESTKSSSSTAVGVLSKDDVLRIVKEVLKIYDADKTGLVDYALESAGGQVISTRCTETYRTKSAEISVFGIPLWWPSNTPRTVISPSVHPGECWAFQGFPGYIVVKLNNLIEVTGFTIEHIPKTLAPEGYIDSAPKKFTVHGLLHEEDKDPQLLGSYEFSADENAASLQYFPVNDDVSQPYQIIELRIESNHGNPKYTCLYRFRVHGNVSKRK